MGDIPRRSLPFIGYIPPHFFLLLLFPPLLSPPSIQPPDLIGRCDAEDLIDRSIYSLLSSDHADLGESYPAEQSLEDNGTATERMNGIMLPSHPPPNSPGLMRLPTTTGVGRLANMSYVYQGGELSPIANYIYRWQSNQLFSDFVRLIDNCIIAPAVR